MTQAAAAASDTLHDIHFGSSFLSSSAAAGAASPPQDALFSLKYAQKPASLDTTAPGRLWADAASPSTVYASFPSTSNGAAAKGRAAEHRFAGKAEPAKEVDCVLIWDEELQSFSLERLEGSLRLTVDREGHGGPTPSLSASHPAPRPPAPPTLFSATASSSRTAQDADMVSSGSSDDGAEIRVPTVPPAHLRKLASDRGKQSLLQKNGISVAAEASANDSGREEERGRARAPTKKQEPEIEDFGDISFGSGTDGGAKVAAEAPKAPIATALKPVPLCLPTSRSSTPVGRPAAPLKPTPPPAPSQTLSLPTKSSPPRPPPQQPVPAPPASTSLAAPSRSSPAAAVASKRPPAPAKASKAPSKTRHSLSAKIPASSSAGPPSPKKSKRRASVAQQSVPLSKATISSSEGSSDGGSSDETSGSGSGSEEEDNGIPEGYLARPGSVLSASAAPAPRQSARKAPMKAPPAAVISDSNSGSGSGSDSDESDDMDLLASSINSTLSGPAVGPGRVQGQIGKGKGGAKRASKIPASGGAAAGARAGYASKVPASVRSSLASKIPASSSVRAAGARAQKGPARSGGYDADTARQREREADVPDSESEED